jgi:pimeloyl-ACP methyl ester carboxylesterase
VPRRLRLVLVHGATSGPWVFEGWLPYLSAFDVRVPDLQAGLDLAAASMSDYAGRVVEEVGEDGALLCGWSMGGLVAMLAAQRQQLGALVLLEPSQPRQLGRSDPSVTPVEGTTTPSRCTGRCQPAPATGQNRCSRSASASAASTSPGSRVRCWSWPAAATRSRGEVTWSTTTAVN